MKALVYHGANDARYEDVPVPTLNEGEVLVKVSHGGICGSDLTVYSGHHWRGRPGEIMGHEFSGEVAEVRATGSDLKPGEHVVVEPLIPCDNCYVCQTGAYNACLTLKVLGIDAPGCFAEYVAVPVERVYRIPESLPLKMAALVEPTAVGCHVVRRSKAKLGDHAVVLGGGTIGLMTAQVARTVTNMPVELVEISQWRQDLARQMGFDPIDPTKVDLKEEILKRTDGIGADLVYDCAGAAQTAALFAVITRIRGQVVQVAMPHDLRPVDLANYAFREIEMVGARTYDFHDYHAAIALVSNGKIAVETMTSHVFPLSEGKDGLDLAAKGDKSMKVLLRP